uniref:Uncharacterized protein n=1 Tax=Arundo donax TaxID=35708 RepID=A0A0A9F0E2_ARUDO
MPGAIKTVTENCRWLYIFKNDPLKHLSHTQSQNQEWFILSPGTRGLHPPESISPLP